MGRSATWIPDRQEAIWIDCDSQAGREMRDIYPFLTLSPRAFNDRTSLVIGLPMSTADYNADNPFAVVAGPAKTRKANKTSYILCHQPKSLDWRARKVSRNPLGRIPDDAFARVPEVLNQIMMLA
jgi:mRNA interferase MazF